MHILIVTHYYPPNEGEAAIRFANTARAFVQKGHRVTVLTTLPHYPKGEIDPAYRGRLVHVREDEGIRVIHTWLWATPNPRISRRLISQLSFMLTAFLRGLPIDRPDAVLIEAQPMFTGIAGRMLARLKGAPYVLNVSDLWPDHLLTVGILKESDAVYQMARRIMDGGYRGAAAVTTMSPAWSRKVIEYLKCQDTDKVHTVMRGADLQRFRPDLPVANFRAARGLGDKRIVSFIGTFATQYDFDLLVDAAARLQDRDDLRFVLYGTGSQRDHVAERIANEQLPNLSLAGWVPHAEIPLAWASSDLTFWAMRQQGLYEGTVPARVFEAFAAGVPVAAAHAGEAAAILNESGGGLAVPPGDLEGFVAAITRLLDERDFYEQCRRNARAYAEQHFDFDRAVDQMEALLIAAAQGRSR